MYDKKYIRNKRKRAAERKKRGMRMLLTTICVLMSIFFVVSANAGDEPVKYEEVFVEFGDTVWSIAAEYADEDTDIRRYVQEIEELNDLGRGGLIAHTVISVPVY